MLPAWARWTGGALLAGACCAGCSAPSRASLPPGQILRSNFDTRTVRLLLEAAVNDRVAGFNFDGYGEGALRVSVPRGWTVVVTCENESTAFTHSCAVVENSAPTTSGAPLAFPGASSAQPRQGLAYRGVSTFQFVASRVGTYRIACLVTGHELDGMWDWFNVTAGGSPSARVTG